MSQSVSKVPFAAIVLAMLPAVLDQTILATALPTVATDLGQVTDLPWVVTAYVVAAAATTPLWGKLGDRRPRLPAAEVDPSDRALDVVGAVLLAGATTALMLACIWGGDRYAWGSPTIVGLGGAFLVLAVALAIRERRAADPIVPLGVLRKPAVAVSSAALFLVTA